MTFNEIIRTVFSGKQRVEEGKLKQTDYEDALEQICRSEGFQHIVSELDKTIKANKDHIQKIYPAWKVLKPSLESRLHIMISQFIAENKEAATHFALIVGMEKSLSDQQQHEIVRKELHRAYDALINSQVEVKNAG